MARKNSRTKRETWRDWLPPGAPDPTPLRTRAQVLANLAALEVIPHVSARDLGYWESEGVLPGAVKQWHEGAVRAVYPDWFLTLVLELRALQQDGYTLTQIAMKLRSPLRIQLTRDLPQQTAIQHDIQRTISHTQETPHESPATSDLREALRRFVLFHAGLTGRLAEYVDIRLCDAFGNVLFEDAIPIDLSPDDSP